MMPKNLYIKTYGCQMNVYDSTRINDLLSKSCDTVKVMTPETADIILLITCSVRAKAEEKVFSDLGRYRKMKTKKPEMIIGIGGCVASQEKDAILKRAPYVDLIFGPQTLHRLPAMLDEVTSSKRRVIDISYPEIEKFDHLPEPKIDGPSALISIMEGCNKHCTYCIVPYTRGKEFSRPVIDVITEINALAKQGVREVTLLGQTINNYRDGEINFAALIRKVAEIKEIERIRFFTSHPLEFSDDLIDAFRDVKKLPNHLHLPVQSGSDQILKRMGRGYTAKIYKEKIEKLRRVRPNISISSDFIIGFPGETDEDFNDTLKLIESIGFDHSFSFIYSTRPGTPAEKLQDDVSLETKKIRLDKLKALLNKIEKNISEKMVGTMQKVLITGTSKKDSEKLPGRTENNRVVNFDGDVKLIGQFVDISITEAQPNSLRGKITVI